MDLFITNNSKKAWKKVNDGRVEMPDYPERAVMEGLVNALIHRNYLETGSEVHVDMFDNRIEIYSPGGMISGILLKKENIMKIPSKRRNPVLADIFNRLKYMERRGSGFKKIIMDYQNQTNYSDRFEPIFEAAYDDFVLTLYNMNYESGTQDGTQDAVQNVIIEMITQNPKVTRKTMAEKLHISTRTLQRVLNDMPNIEYIGTGSNGHWEIKKCG